MSFSFLSVMSRACASKDLNYSSFCLSTKYWLTHIFFSITPCHQLATKEGFCIFISNHFRILFRNCFIDQISVISWFHKYCYLIGVAFQILISRLEAEWLFRLVFIRNVIYVIRMWYRWKRRKSISVFHSFWQDFFLKEMY